ncbi:MAG: efflux RND transporter permease subunit, partial [Myxococcales bacterium]
PKVGRDFFPTVDAGQLRLHVTAPPGTRIEETERYFERVEDVIRELIPASDRELILDQIGLPQGYSLAITDSAAMSSADGELLVRLKHDRKHPTLHYIEELRRELPKRFPELGFYFQPADIVTQILNFGLPSPISIQVTGPKLTDSYATAQAIAQRLRQTTGVTDVRVHQVLNAPRLHLDVDRVRANEVGLTERDVASDLLVTLASGGQVSPSYWVDPASGNSYPVVVQVPDTTLDSLDELTGVSVSSPRGPQMIADLARVERRVTPLLQSHADLQQAIEVRADVRLLDLGSIAPPVEAIVEEFRAKVPPGGAILLRGQLDSMKQGFWGLGLGLGLAVFLVYGLMVVNFQSWLDPFIILLALPGAGAGIVIGLLLVRTPFSIPALMGAVMSVGVATANSTLMVSFANERRDAGSSSIEAAFEAGMTRLRPVLMTALAMGIGMLPMAIGHGEGGEQNAALARAVLGGLVGATFATLFFVPVAFSLLRARERKREVDPDLEDDAPRHHADS